MRPSAAALLAAVAVAVTAISASSAGTSASGLEGKVLRGPTQPVCVAGRPCQAPMSATLAFWRAGREVARVKSSRAGDYRVALAPGVYTVLTVFPRTPWRVLPSTARVPAGRYARVNFLIDTGIR